MSQAAVGWLMLAAAMFLLVGGLLLRSFVGRRADRSALGRMLRRLRTTRFGRLFFGPVHGDALEPEELDQMILMPVIVVACGICLTALFLLGYVLLAP
ncbi:hypothetical protein AB0K11_12875 [Mycobacterium sp. NPDC050551]|uniref:hypothetical protein n=1 Tax=Mycobacterium sp. NPDC050551 TaxID=3155407 RepID=UPI00343F6711